MSLVLTGHTVRCGSAPRRAHGLSFLLCAADYMAFKYPILLVSLHYACMGQLRGADSGRPANNAALATHQQQP